jgi:hypothetical protein
MAEIHASFAQVSYQHFRYIILITRGGLDQFITVVNNVMQILAAIYKKVFETEKRGETYKPKFANENNAQLFIFLLQQT